MPKALNCRTAVTAFDSLTGVLSIEPARLCAILDDYVIHDEFPDGPQEPAMQLLDRVLRVSGTHCCVESTHWFHATRVSSTGVLRSGIAPLGHVIDTIWDDIYRMAPESVPRSSLEELRRWIENGGGGRYGKLYRLRTGDEFYWGPFAFLVRDAILKASDAGHRDYLSIPELIEDIAYCATSRLGWDLATAYRATTAPVIVEFVAHGDSAISNVRAALYYVYCQRKRLGQSTLTNTCFDAKAHPIEADRIVSVERVAPRGHP